MQECEKIQRCVRRTGLFDPCHAPRPPPGAGWVGVGRAAQGAKRPRCAPRTKRDDDRPQPP